MRATRTAWFSLAALAAVGLALCVAGPSFARGGGGPSGGGGSGNSNTKTQPKKTVLDMLGENTDLSKFTAAVKAAGLDTTLKGAGPFTVLAPNDAAFGKIDAKWQELSKAENKAKLKALLDGHIVSGKKKAAEIGKEKSISGGGGVSHEIKLSDDKKSFTIDGAKIVKEDVEASNGYVQVVDAVLMPADKAPGK